MIAVVTDSTCDLHPDNARQLGIHVVPLQITTQGRTLLDWVEVDPDAVYDHMRELFENATSDATLDSKLRDQGVVFFLHLLGLDTTGHSYRPHSKARSFTSDLATS